MGPPVSWPRVVACVVLGRGPMSNSVSFLCSAEEEDVDVADVSRVPTDVLRNVEADTYWCMSKLLDGIQVSWGPAGVAPEARVGEPLLGLSSGGFCSWSRALPRATAWGVPCARVRAAGGLGDRRGVLLRVPAEWGSAAGSGPHTSCSPASVCDSKGVL